MSKEAKALYEMFKKEYINSGYLYSGMLLFDVETKDTYKELEKLGLIQIRTCEGLCYELTETERIKLLEEFNLEEKWKEEHSCFLFEGQFEEIRKLNEFKKAS